MTNVLFNIQTSDQHDTYLGKNVVELPFINNNTFAGYLHSRGAVQHFCPDLLGSMHLY